MIPILNQQCFTNFTEGYYLAFDVNYDTSLPEKYCVMSHICKEVFEWCSSAL